MRWVLHSDRRLCVGFLLENSRFFCVCLLILLAYLSGIVRLEADGERQWQLLWNVRIALKKSIVWRVNVRIALVGLRRVMEADFCLM